jgi:hypothetical protein
LSGLRQLQAAGDALPIFGAAASDALCSLPLLNELNVHLGGDAHVRFLAASCAALRKLKLVCAPMALTQAEIMDGLSCCTELTDLELQSAPVDSDALILLLPRFPHLTRLALIHLELTSLSCFSSAAALAASLTELRLHFKPTSFRALLRLRVQLQRSSFICTASASCDDSRSSCADSTRSSSLTSSSRSNRRTQHSDSLI